MKKFTVKEIAQSIRGSFSAEVMVPVDTYCDMEVFSILVRRDQ